LRLALLGSALAPDFITEGRCLILYGKPGRGKTHLAVALAYRAIQNGFDAYFTTAAELIDDLSAAFRRGRLAEALTQLHAPRATRRRRSRPPADARRALDADQAPRP
jgi:DNA replication protein DnaC